MSLPHIHLLSLLFSTLLLVGFGAAAGLRGVDLEKRDTFAPARVPYILPPPGTDPVRLSRGHISCLD